MTLVAAWAVQRMIRASNAMIYAEGRIEGEADAGGFVTVERAEEIYAQCGVPSWILRGGSRVTCGDGGEAEEVC